MTNYKPIFVFGSNLAGIHGAGSARAAVDNFGAEYGVGVGLRGNTYAIPTKDKNIETLPIEDVKYYIAQFIEFARAHPEYLFLVVKIGCGLADFKEKDIAPLFADSPSNVTLPTGWKDWQ